MFYELFIVMFGVYMGQEYQNLPSIKIVIHKCLEYVNNIDSIN